MLKIVPNRCIPISGGELLTLTRKILLGESVEGEDVSKFERSLSDYLGTKKTFAFNSGRVSLYVALRSLNLKPKDEVIVPAYTCAIVFEVILRLGLKPVLVDVNPETYNIQPFLIERVVNTKTKAIIPVHLFGCPCEMDHIMEIARQHGLYVIEDVAQALGAEFRGKKVGTFGDLSIFSFGPGKSITGGEGGAVTINKEEFSDRIYQIQSTLPLPDYKWILNVTKNIMAMYIFSKPYLYPFIMREVKKSVKMADDRILGNCLSILGGKRQGLHPTLKLMKMPDMVAAFLSLQLKKIDELNEKRISNFIKLTESLEGISARHLSLPRMYAHAKSTFTRYIVRVLKKNREDVLQALLMRQIDAEKPYDYLPLFFLNYANVTYPNANMLCKSLVSLPNHPLMTVDDLNEVSSAIGSVFGVK